MQGNLGGRGGKMLTGHIMGPADFSYDYNREGSDRWQMYLSRWMQTLQVRGASRSIPPP